jgi:predicted permease
MRPGDQPIDREPSVGAPLWARLALRLFLSREDRRVVLDELGELRALRRASLGERGARRWLRRELLRYPARLLAERVRRGLRSALSGARRLGASSPGPGLSTLGIELRSSLRALRRNPRFVLAVTLTLALGVGAATAILTVTKRVLVDPLPYPNGEALAIVWSALPEVGYARAPISGPELDDLRRRSRHFADFGSIWTTTATLVESEKPRTLRFGLVTASFLELLGAAPILGRSLAPADEGSAAAPALLLSEGLWRERFAADPEVLGRTLRLDGGWGFPGGLYAVVGVLPSTFRLVLPADAGVATDLDAFAAFPFDLADAQRGQYFLRTIGRLAAGSSLALAREEVRAIGAELAREHPVYGGTGRALDVVSLHGDSVATARPVLVALLAGAGVLLLIAASNVASLLFARTAARRAEAGLRAALGASRARIAGHLLLECIALALLGGVAGALLGGWGAGVLAALAPSRLPRADELGLDPTVLAVAIGISLLGGVVFGLAPALAASRAELMPGLRAGGRGALSQQRGRNALVVAELALVFVLSVAALLCQRTVARLGNQDLGFSADGVLTFELTLPRQRYGDEDRLGHFGRELDRRLGSLPGVAAAGAINQLPLSDLPNWSSPYRPVGPGRQHDEALEADARVVTPGYLRAVGARLVEGRLFDGGDDETSRQVAIVDRLLAERTWPGESAVGREIEIEVSKSQGFVTVSAEVVGVVEHMRHHDPRFEVREQLFVPFAQGARNQMSVALRASGDPRSLLGPIRRELRAIDPDLALSRIRLLGDYVDDARAVQRFTLVLAAVFAATALLLASVGLYGVLSYLVGLRRRELGLRLALGSTPAAIGRLVLRRGLALVGAGIALGLLGVLAVREVLATLLYGVSPTDPVVLTAIPALLAAVGLLACWVPARRALRTDPTEMLRSE